jgi:hypothetical protein
VRGTETAAGGRRGRALRRRRRARYAVAPRTAMQKLRIVTLGISGGSLLTGSLDTMLLRTGGYTYDVGVWIFPSFKGHFLSRRAKP